jgi:hypothetical protein
MCRVIFKYELPDHPCRFSLPMPERAEVLSFGQQDGTLVLWALLDPAINDRARQFQLVFTGKDCTVRNTDRFVGTVTTPDRLVWHLFETRP